MRELGQEEEIVRTDKLQKRSLRLPALLLLIIILSILAILNFRGRSLADETIPVTCYKDRSRIGTVTVFDWKAAAATCNQVLYDCRGVCIGCFRDSDYINDVCIDTQGNEFLR
jgi:hypothetical protein